MLKINEKFAKRYDQYRRKEELQKLKDRLGNAKVADLKAAAAEESSSESEDSDAEAWTPELEKGFLRVYAALQTKDSRLYDPSVSWFDAKESPSDEEKDEEDEEKEKKQGKKNGGKHKPMYFNEYQREYLLRRGYEHDDELPEKRRRPAADDSEEAEQIRASLRAEGSGDDDDEEADDLLVKRSGSDAPEAGDSVRRLHDFVTDEADDGRQLDAECRQDLEKLRRIWTDERLSEEEKYLRDYITKEYWREAPQDSVPTYQQIVGDSDDSEGGLSADEEFLTRQKEFEAKWNNRTEEQDEEFEQNFRRTFASADDDDDDDDDDDLFVAKATGEEAPAEAEAEEAPAEILDELRRLEARRQWTTDGELREPDEPDADEEEEREPSAKTYPRSVPDSLRQSAASARARARAERRERRRDEKSRRRKEIEELVRLREEELQRRLQRLRRNAGTDAVGRQLDDEFMEADFDPEEHDRRMAAIFDQGFYGEGEARPQFSDDDELADGEEAETKSAKKSQTPKEKKKKKEKEKEEEEVDDEEEERLRRELSAAERQQAEDFIRGGPGEAELRCRFNYRQVEPVDFGLDPVEILLADDRELNAWCSVRKMSQYRSREAELRDKRRFRSGRAQARKLRLMPLMLRRLAEAERQPQPPAPGLPPAEVEAGADAEVDAEAEANAGRKRRRRKKKRRSRAGGEEAEEAADAADAGGRGSRKRRRSFVDDADASADDVAAPEAASKPKKAKAKAKATAKAKAKAKAKKTGDRLQISDERLRDLGIEPKRFKRLQRIGVATTPRRQLTAAAD